MGSNEVNWIPKSLKDEYDLSDPTDQDLFVMFLSLAENDTIVKVLEQVLPSFKIDPLLDNLVVRLSQGIISHRSDHLTEIDRDHYTQLMIRLMSDEDRFASRNTIYQLTK